MQTGKKAVGAQLADATRALQQAQALPADPPPEFPRRFDDEEIAAGQWPGAPMNAMPPGCPVIPLGLDGKTYFFVDTLGQLKAVAASEWGKKALMDLFSATPNYLYWAWPRLSAPKKGAPSKINGLEVDEACGCLMKAASAKGLFDPTDSVRGRGGWQDSQGAFLWHSGAHLWRAAQGRMTHEECGDVDGQFYARRPPIMIPWAEAVSEAESPGHDILAALDTWNWEREPLDKLLMLGFIASCFYGAALPWRPTVFLTGDKGRGKSTLQGIVKALLGNALHATADTTAAGIYQRVKQDSLPVAVDELEANEDNRRVIAVVQLARLAASGAEMFRGGAEHEGVTFRARNSFFFSSINPPPLGPQDRSRMAILALGRVDPSRSAAASLENPAVLGRQLLRRMMDGWRDFARVFKGWRDMLRAAGLDGRGQDTYGVLLACAEIAIGQAGLEDAGLPVTDEARLIELIASLTAEERGMAADNWRICLERLLSWTLDSHRSGERPVIGDVLDRAAMPATDSGSLSTDEARKLLAVAGIGLKGERGAEPRERLFLAVPPRGAQIEKIFAGTPMQKGVWMDALRQGPPGIVQRGKESRFVVKINGSSHRCLLIDMAAFRKLTEDE